MSVKILIGDCRARLAELADASVDSVVCDPPYHLTSIVKRFGSETAAPAKSNGATGVYGRASKGFMGQTWDGGDVAFDPDTWAEVLRVLKPGGHLIAFSGTRTYHRMVCAIEDAGFEIRDQIGWAFGSGFPKSLDVSKQIDKAAGAERTEVISSYKATGTARTLTGGNYGGGGNNVEERDEIVKLAPVTDAAREWQGWGTALKPSWEPICLARKPLIGTVAANVLAHGTGALNIDGCRIATDEVDPNHRPGETETTDAKSSMFGIASQRRGSLGEGRWPANLCHDGSEEVLAGFPDVHGAGAAREEPGGGTYTGESGIGFAKDGRGIGVGLKGFRIGDSGSAARFFATFPIGDDEWEFAKNVHAAKSAESQCGSCGTPIAGGPAATLILDSNDAESQAGRASIGICEGCIPSLSHALSVANRESTGTIPTIPSCSKSSGSATPAIAPIIRLERGERVADANGQELETRFLYCPKATTDERGEGNNHPTVKPVALMRWLCRLVTPKGGTVLDPFMGSGSTMIAADAEQFNAIGCELSEAYAEIAEQRIRESSGLFADVVVSRPPADELPAEVAA